MLPAGRFRFRLLPTLATIAGLIVLLNLCAWQLRRHEEKNAWLPQARTARSLPPLGEEQLSGELSPRFYRRFVLEGAFVEPQMLEGGRGLGGLPAYALLQPYRTVGGLLLLVDRGELLRGGMEASLQSLRGLAVPRIEGELRPLPDDDAHEPVPGQQDPLIWARRGLVGIHGHVEGLLPGVYLRSGPVLPPGVEPRPSPILADGARPLLKRWSSLHYAKQWGAMAGVLLLLWLYASFERTSELNPRPPSS